MLISKRFLLLTFGKFVEGKTVLDLFTCQKGLRNCRVYENMRLLKTHEVRQNVSKIHYGHKQFDLY